jgi:hypothetical protein
LRLRPRHAILNDIRFFKILMQATACSSMPIRRIGFGFKNELLQNFLNFMVSSSIYYAQRAAYFGPARRTRGKGSKQQAGNPLRVRVKTRDPSGKRSADEGNPDSRILALRGANRSFPRTQTSLWPAQNLYCHMPLCYNKQQRKGLGKRLSPRRARRPSPAPRGRRGTAQARNSMKE